MYGLGDIDFAAIDRQQALSPSLHAEAQRVIKIAEAGTVAITVLQAVAAFSALTLAIIAWKNYSDSKKSKRSSRRSTFNPKRRTR